MATLQGQIIRVRVDMEVVATRWGDGVLTRTSELELHHEMWFNVNPGDFF